MKTRWGFVLLILLAVVTTICLGPRLVYELWVAEELTQARVETLGLGRIFDVPPEREAKDHVAEFAALHDIASGQLPTFAGSAQLFDPDNDGDLDLFATRMDGDTNQPSRFYFHLNDGAGRFREVGKDLGSAFKKPRLAGRSISKDVDEDGRVDLVIELKDGTLLVLWNRLARREKPSERPMSNEPMTKE
jgi:hypothetical protein